jgi:putative transposase
MIGARLMSAQEEPPPPEAAARKRTKSFICELPLRVTPAQERVLLARLEAARQVYNACLGEAKRRVGLVRESKAFQRACALPKEDQARRTLFREARTASACSEYALHGYADQLRQSWLGEHLDSNTCQKLATRAYQAANRLLLGKARRVRFKGRHQLPKFGPK